jgi:hypothetical protein
VCVGGTHTNKQTHKRKEEKSKESTRKEMKEKNGGGGK